MRKQSPFKRFLAVTLASVMTFSQSGVATIAEEANNAPVTEEAPDSNAGAEETAPAEVKSAEESSANTVQVTQGAETTAAAAKDDKEAGSEPSAAEAETTASSDDETNAAEDTSDAAKEETADAAGTDEAEAVDTDDTKAAETDDAEDAGPDDAGTDGAEVTQAPENPEEEAEVTEDEEEASEDNQAVEEEKEESSEDEEEEASGEEGEEKEDSEEEAEDPEEAASYKVTFITDEHIHVFVDEEEIEKGLALAENGTLSFTTAADEGYVVADVLVNKKTLDPEEGIYTITGIGDDNTVVTIKAEEEEPEYYAGELEFNGSDYIVKMNITEAAQIPADASLAVREIPEGSLEYEQLFNDANRALYNNADEKAVTRARFFDIQILATVKAEDGTEKIDEVEPKAPVAVEIKYIQPVEVADSNNVDMVHFAETGTEVVASGTDATPTADGTEEVKKVEFNAEGFSVYGFMYTVIFTYDGFSYTLSGEGSVLLSELAAALNLSEVEIGRAFDVNNVANVEFTNQSLVSVSKVDGDWLLESLASFETEETLTVTMDNGSKFVVNVTDPVSSNLTDFLKDVTITGAQTGPDGKPVVVEGAPYTINMSFSGSSGIGVEA